MMTRSVWVATLLASFSAFAVVTVANAHDAATPATKSEMHAMIEEFSAQSQKVLHRTPRRVRIYRETLGPDAVRVCRAYYEQEYRLSGTVIVPRMNCYWRG